MKVVATIIMVFAMLFFDIRGVFAACRLRGVRVKPAAPM
jgi:hypothetical protein